MIQNYQQDDSKPQNLSKEYLNQRIFQSKDIPVLKWPSQNIQFWDHLDKKLKGRKLLK